MKLYHVSVLREDGWYIGRVLERPGVTTQGRTLDELVDMLRDAIELMWSEPEVHLELILSPQRRVTKGKKPGRTRAIA